MSVRDLPVERRRRRSQEVLEAITYQLQHLADQYDLRNLALADSRGLLLACASQKTAEGRALAAYAPVFTRHLGRGTRSEILDKLGGFLPGVSGQTLSVRRFRLQGEDHFLCVVGDERLCRQANLYRAVTGIRRIVEETSAAA